MFRIKLLTYLTMLAVLAAYGHCLSVHGTSVQQQLSAPSGEPGPAGDPPSCENESACICKGAVLSSAALDLPGDDFVGFLALDAFLPSAVDEVVPTAVSPRQTTPPPPLDGDAMRAQLQVLRL